MRHKVPSMRSLNWFRRRHALHASRTTIQRRAPIWRIGFSFLVILLAQANWLSAAEPPTVLPGTQPLTTTGDIASDLVAGVDRFLLRKLDESARRPAFLGTNN